MILRMTAYSTTVTDPGDFAIDADTIYSVVENEAKDGTPIAILFLRNGESRVVRDIKRTAMQRWVQAYGAMIDEDY